MFISHSLILGHNCTYRILGHRLTTPYISESFKFSLSTENIEEQRCDFHRAGLIIAYSDLVLGSVIGCYDVVKRIMFINRILGHGEFGG